MKKWNVVGNPEVGYNRHIEVLVTTRYGDVAMWHVAKDGYGKIHWNCYIDSDGRYCFENEIEADHVTAWMYLPEPYKEAKEW